MEFWSQARKDPNLVNCDLQTFLQCDMSIPTQLPTINGLFYMVVLSLDTSLAPMHFYSYIVGRTW